MWCPELHQIIRKRNDSYLQSLWIGLCMPLLLLPKVLFHAFLVPICLACFRGILEVVKVFVYLPIIGLQGHASGVDIEIPEAPRKIIVNLPADEAAKVVAMIEETHRKSIRRREEEGRGE